MSTLLNDPIAHPIKVYPDYKSAHKDASALQSGDPDWKYTVDTRRDYTCTIMAYDESGEFVDYWRL